MSVQIAVRLEDEDIRFLDEQEAHGLAASRAEVVRRGIQLVRKQERIRREIKLLTKIGEPAYPDLEPMHEHVQDHRPSLDD